MTASKASDAAHTTNRVALDALLDRLRRWENPEVESKTGPTYRAMCDSATVKATGLARAALAKRQADEA